MQGAARRRAALVQPAADTKRLLNETQRCPPSQKTNLGARGGVVLADQRVLHRFYRRNLPPAGRRDAELPPAAMAPASVRGRSRRSPRGPTPTPASPQGRTPHLAAASRRGRAARRLHGAGRERGGGPGNMAERCGRTSGGKEPAAPGRVTHSPAGCRRRFRAEEGTTRRPRREATRGGDGRGHRPFEGWSRGRPRPEPPGGSGRRGAALRGGPRGARGWREKGRRVELLKHIFILQLNN